MHFCDDHWSKLRAAIAERGLNKFVPSSGEEAAERLATGGFDPLMGAHNAIVAAAIHDAGIGVMMDDQCPLCLVKAQCAGLDVEWIEGSSDDQLMVARKRGELVGN